MSLRLPLWLLVLLCLGSASAEEKQHKFELSAGLGASYVEPKPVNGSPYEVSDNTSWGYRLSGGYFLTSRVIAELYYANLGQAKIALAATPDDELGGIKYASTGISLGYRLFPEAQPWNVFGKYGVNFLHNEATSSAIDFNNVYGSQVMFGFGGLYQYDQWLFRLDADTFSRDAKLLTVGLSYVIGQEKEEPAPADADRDGVEDWQDYCLATPRGMSVDAEGCEDSDQDGVTERYDQCPGTPKGTVVDSQGCPAQVAADAQLEIDQLDLAAIQFNLDSAELTDSAKQELQNLLSVLLKFPNTHVKIEAHTDSQGDDAYNFSLSNQRAESVRIYLQESGVEASRLSSEGFGETRPIDTNETEAGRSNNRRVEFKIFLSDQN